jgi:hypothetical protein
MAGLTRASLLRCIMTGRDNKPRGIDFEQMEADFHSIGYFAH